MGNMRYQAIVVLVAIMMLGIAFVPAVGASSDESEEWVKDHTLKVKSTKAYKYNGESLEIKETYSGKELKKKIGVNKLTKEQKIPVEVGEFKLKKGKMVVTENEILLMGDNAETIKLKKGKEKVSVSSKSVVLTSANDPYEWWKSDSDYPRWTWSRVFCWFGNCWYEMEDPINIVWDETNLGEVKSVMLDKGWTANPQENVHYVSGPQGWFVAEGVAESTYRFFGGDHARLWEMSKLLGDSRSDEYDDIVSNVHRDDGFFEWPLGHQVKLDFEVTEDKIAGFYDDGEEVIQLGNKWANEYGAYNDGNATLIS